jgi:hypothetical protein
MGLEGAAFGLFPILWIVVNAIWIYNTPAMRLIALDAEAERDALFVRHADEGSYHERLRRGAGVGGGAAPARAHPLAGSPHRGHVLADGRGRLGGRV